MLHFPETFRLRGYHGGHTGGDGAFVVNVKSPNKFSLCIIASSGEGWEHVSVHAFENGADRTPTWKEMEMVKRIFWEATDWVVQFHPAIEDYINRHEHTLHLWRPINQQLPKPPKDLV